MMEQKGCCQKDNEEGVCSTSCLKRCYKKKCALAVSVFVILCILPFYSHLFSKNDNTISVLGIGSVSVHPDGALVNFGVMTIKATTPEEAIKANAEKISDITKALLAAGIPEQNQSVTGYVLDPIFGNNHADANGNVSDSYVASITGYTATQQITVRIPDIDANKTRVDDIILTATKAGANQVGEVKFISSKIEQLKEEARLAALNDGQKKAAELSKISGVELGKITGWYESPLAVPGESYPDPSVSNSPAESSYNLAPSGYTILAPGQLDVVIEMNINYEIR